MKRVLVCTAMLLWSALAGAVVYKWVDAHGKVQYGDRPPDGVVAEIVDMPGIHTRQPAVRSTPPVPAAAQASVNAALDAAAQDDAKKAVDSDVAQAREKQCAEAQDRYKKLIEGRKLYKLAADGQRQYLTSEEIDSERVSAKRDVDATCNGPS